MLHAHIPFCRKSGVWPAGEEWLFEAMHETYIPLLSVFRKFQRDHLKPRIMVGIVPILAEQLADRYMNDRFCAYMEDKILRAEQDIARFTNLNDPRKNIAIYYRDLFHQTYYSYKSDFFRNILGSFKWFQEEGVIDLLTSGATHGFLPLLENESAIFSQIHLGITTYEKHFGRKPRGFWLPECAYRPERAKIKGKGNMRPLDEWLADEKIQYFFVENVGIERAQFVDNPHHEQNPTTYRGYKLESGVCVFGRNTPTGKQVWSPDGGYPGDPYYREFHIKDNESGLQYLRITRSDPKQIYDPQKAVERANLHADHFIGLITEHLQKMEKFIPECPPIIMAPFDCELYGHWWHEGPTWIDAVYRRIKQQSFVQPLVLEEYIHQYSDTFATIRMQSSTWGENSDFTVWNSPEHNWLWPYINAACYDVEAVLSKINPNTTLLPSRHQRILRQLCRELLLLEGSDWPFLLFTKQAKEYANQRFHSHHQRFNKLLWAAKNLDDSIRINDQDLAEMEAIDNPWADLDPSLFVSK